MATESPSPVEGNLLDSFLNSVDNFVRRISALAAEAAPKDGEHQILIQSTGESLVGQTSRLSAFTRETAARLSAPQRAELDTFLRVQDGNALAQRAVEVTEQQLKAGAVGKLPQWISKHLGELKKVFLEILGIVFELLHLPFPSWINKISLLIDQIMNLLLSLLADVFGYGSARTAQELSVQEVSYLNELAAMELLRAAQSGRRHSLKDET